MQKIINVEDLVAQLKPFLRRYLEEQGTEFKGPLMTCPNRDQHAHGDSKPSAGFVPDTEDSVWNCFSCNTSSDIFGAYSLLEGKDIQGQGWFEAIKELADRYKISYEVEPLSPEEQEQTNVQQFLSNLVKHSHNYLLDNPQSSAYEYINSRGWEEVIRHFKIGYVPKTPSFESFFKDQFGKYPEIAKIISIHPDQLYDRVIYPVYSVYGSILGIMTRSITNENDSIKYRKHFLKSLEKGGVLFNLTKEFRTVYIVEGGSSVFTMYKNGIKNVIALNGKLFSQQMYNSLIKVGVNKIVLCYDGDNQGQKGMEDALSLTQDKSDIKVAIKTLPEGKDPDEFIKEFGVEVFKEIPEISNFKFQLERLKTANDTTYANYKKSVYDIVNSCSDLLIKDKMAKMFMGEMNISKTVFSEELHKFKITKNVTDDVGVADILAEENHLLKAIGEFEENSLRCGKLKGLPIGFPILEEKIDGLQPGLILISGRWNCLAKGTKVLTANGDWVNIEDIKKGDYLAHHTLGKTKVLNSWFSGVKPMYKITFKNGKSVEASKEHRFPCTFGQREHYGYVGRRELHENIGSQWGLKTVEQIIDYIDKNKHKKYNNKGYIVNYNDVVYIKNAKLPDGNLKWEFDPYLVGTILGDGNVTTNIRFGASSLKINAWKKYLDENKIEYSVSEDKRYGNNFDLTLLKQSKLRDFITKSVGVDKHIPSGFLLLSIEDRKRLLAGLIDTDGSMRKDSAAIEYGTISPVMAIQVEDLVYSIGGRCRTKLKKTHYRDKDGNKVFCKDYYRMDIYLTTDIPTIIKTQVKTERVVDGFKISKIEYSGDKESYDIEIDAQDHLFICENWILSHNCGKSAWLQTLALNLLQSPTNFVLYFSIDDPTIGATVPRMVANLAEIPINTVSNPIHRIDNNTTINAAEKLVMRQQREKAIDVMKSYSGRLGIKDSSDGFDTNYIEKLIKIYKSIAGERNLVVIVDFLNMVKWSAKAVERTEQETQLAFFFKNMSNVYNCPIVCTVEANKGIADARIKEADIKGSASISFRSTLTLLLSSDFEADGVEDSGNMFFYDNNGVANPIVRVSVSKNKGSGFKQSLFFKFYKQYSKFVECDEQEQIDFRKKLR